VVNPVGFPLESVCIMVVDPGVNPEEDPEPLAEAEGIEDGPPVEGDEVVEDTTRAFLSAKPDPSLVEFLTF